MVPTHAPQAARCELKSEFQVMPIALKKAVHELRLGADIEMSIDFLYVALRGMDRDVHVRSDLLVALTDNEKV